jgi:hypothetical protein
LTARFGQQQDLEDHQQVSQYERVAVKGNKEADRLVWTVRLLQTG